MTPSGMSAVERSASRRPVAASMVVMVPATAVTSAPDLPAIGGPGLFHVSRLPPGWNRRRRREAEALGAGLRPGPAGRRERLAKRAALTPLRATNPQRNRRIRSVVPLSGAR